MSKEFAVREYDLRELNRTLDRGKQRDLIVSGLAAVFCTAIVSFLAVVNIPKLLVGSIAPFSSVVLIVVIVWLLVIIVVLVRGMPGKRRGPAYVRVGSEGMELGLMPRSPIRIRWSDADIQIELQDLSMVNADVMSVPARHFLKAKGLYSALSKQAFDAILEQVRAHDLAEEIRPAGRRFLPPGSTVHVVRIKQAS